jgi:hypothetical protein
MYIYVFFIYIFFLNNIGNRGLHRRSLLPLILMEDNRRIIVDAYKDNVRNGSVCDLMRTKIGTLKNF